MKPLLKNFSILLLAFLLIASVFSFFVRPTATPKDISITDIPRILNEGSVTRIVQDNEKIEITLKDGTLVSAYKEPGESLTTTLRNLGVDPAKLQAVPLEIKGESTSRLFLGTILPFMIPFLLIAALVFFMVRQVQGMNRKTLMFGQSGVRETNPDKKHAVTFAQVAGAHEAKQELEEIVDFLKNPKKFTEMGAKIPKGVLLLGPPGVGKTLLARAVAGEAQVPFFHISGSEFVEMFVGVGASRVRDAFQKAKKSAPAILFIDELDAVGRHRGSGLGGSHDEREQTLNQILVEMDGFEPNQGVVVIAATNRPDVLDPALLRPGRFDRRVMLDLPDINDREAILKIHAQKKPLVTEANLRTVAERTPGFSGADLANVLNEAAIKAARENKKKITLDMVLLSIEKVLLGPERKSHLLSPAEKKITAYHEVGHAIVAHELPQADPVHKISIISRGRAAGYTLKLPDNDRKLHTRSEMLANMASMLGGYVAEQEIFEEITTGASDDLRKATELARHLVMDYGMSTELGPMTFGEHEDMIFLGKSISEQRNYSEKTAERIDQEVANVIRQAHELAKKIITSQRDLIDKITRALLEKETLERAEFEAFFKPAPVGVN